MAAHSFYSSISGSKRLPPPYDQFYTYPCLSPPQVHFEFGGWNVEVLKGRRDKGSSAPGGRFSLGRMEEGSGYCVGMIVESRMGVEAGSGGGNGLMDVWVIGEPFFRDVQVAFDVCMPEVIDLWGNANEVQWKAKQVGMQRV